MRSSRGSGGVCPTILALVLGLALAAAGCGGESATDSEQPLVRVREAVAGLTGAPRAAKLAKLAAKEGGELNLYTSLLAEDEQEFAEAFEDEFDIAVTVYRASSESIAQRLLEEHEAEFPGADVTDLNGLELSVLADRGILLPYRPDNWRGLVDKSWQRTWTVTRFNKYVVSWNTGRVEAGEQPKTWEELAQPRWKGRLGVEVGDVDWYVTLRRHLIEDGRSPAEADRVFAGIFRNSILVHGHSLLAELLGAGELDVAVTNFRHLIDDRIADGSPISWKPAVEPVISRPGGVGLVAGAKHPATALLFIDWLTNEGQELIHDQGRDAARRDLATAPGLAEVQIDVASLSREQEKWLEKFDRLLRLGKSHSD